MEESPTDTRKPFHESSFPAQVPSWLPALVEMAQNVGADERIVYCRGIDTTLPLPLSLSYPIGISSCLPDLPFFPDIGAECIRAIECPRAFAVSLLSDADEQCELCASLGSDERLLNIVKRARDPNLHLGGTKVAYLNEQQKKKKLTYLRNKNRRLELELLKNNRRMK